MIEQNKSCKDCKFCKINLSKKTLRCMPGIDEHGNDKSHWRKDNEDGNEEHIFKLDLSNEFLKKNIKLNHRKVFEMAEKCEDYLNEWV